MHIFPKDHCEKKNYPRAKWNSVVNKTPITYSTNREIGGSAPSVYLGKIASKGQVNPNELDCYLESHWIDVNAARSDDFNAFIVGRAIMLLDAIATAMGKPISGRDGEEVIHNFGKVLTH